MPDPEKRPHFRVRPYLGPIVAGSIALFSLLMTNQLVWSAVDQLSQSLTGTYLWLIPDQSRSQSNRDVYVQFIAPPGATVDINQDNVETHSVRIEQKRGLAGYPVRLYRGSNTIVLTLENDPQNPYFGSILSTFEYHGAQVAPPMIAAVWRENDTLRLLGFGEPNMGVALNLNGQPGTSASIDASGAFAPGLPPAFLNAKSPRRLAAAYSDSPKPGAAWPEPDVIDLTDAPLQTFHGADAVFSRKLEVSISAEGYKLAGEVTMPETTALYQDAQDGQDAQGRMYSALRMLDAVFGVCFAVDNTGERGRVAGPFDAGCGDDRRLGPSISTVDANDGKMEFEISGTFPSGVSRVHLVRRARTNLASTFLELPSDTLALKQSGGSLRPQALPFSQSGAGVEWKGAHRATTNPELTLATITVPTPPQGPTGGTAPGPQARSSISNQTQSILERIRALEALPPPNVRQALYILLAAIPFIWFVYIASAFAPDSRKASSLKAIAMTFLVLHLTILALSVFEASIGGWVSEMVRNFVPNGDVETKLERIFNGVVFIYPFLAIGMACLVRPVYRAFLRPSRKATLGTKLLRAPLWLVFWIIVIGAPVAAIAVRFVLMNGWKESFEGTAILLGGSLLLLWFVLYWLLARVFRIEIKVRNAICASSAMAVLPVVPPLTEAAMGQLRTFAVTLAGFYPWFLPNRAAPFVWTAVVTILAAYLLRQTGLLALKMAPSLNVRVWLQSRSRWLVTPALLVIGFPATQALSSVFTFTAFFYRIDYLLVFALALGAISLAASMNREDHFNLSEGLVQLGGLVFAVFLCGQSSILFIPIPLLLGWFMFRHWLLIPMPHRIAHRGDVMRKFIEERRARSTVEDMQQGLTKKLAQGDLTPAEYHSRLDAMQAEATASSEALRTVYHHETEPDVFAFGPENGPWKNARTAVIYGSVIAVPFFISTLGATLQKGGSDFPLLDLLYAVIVSSASWILTAAIFGYFFHRIRGRNGFEKALCFAAAMIIPTLPLRILAGQQLLQPEPLLGVVEIIAFLLVLALVAFDLGTLHKEHFGWRDLFTVYGFASAAYGSTIAIATAVALWGKDIGPYLIKAIGWLTGTGKP